MRVQPDAVFELIPIPSTPLIQDALAASIIGGIFAGAGIGISLQSGGSSGGMDIVGMCLTRRYKGISVGKVSLAVNTVIYGICALLFGVQTFVYSLIYSVVSMLMTDRTHTQNISIQKLLFLRKRNPQRSLII